MPQLRQYVSRDATRGRAFNTSRATPNDLDFTPLAKAAQNIVNDAQAVSETQRQLAEVQKRQREQLEMDEARVSVANTMSEASVTWTERIVNAQQQAPRDAAGFTESTLKEFDDWAKQRSEATTNPKARALLDDGLRKMRLGLHAEAFKFEVGQRNKALVQDYGDGLDADRRTVMADPSQFSTILARRLATADVLSLQADDKAKLKSDTRASLAYDAGQGMVSTYDGAVAFLERAGQQSTKGARGEPGAMSKDAAARVASDPMLSSLAPADMRKLIDRASMTVAQKQAADEARLLRESQEREHASAKRSRAADQAWNILSGALMDGRKLDMGAKSVQDAMAAIQGTPYAQAFKDALAESPQRQAAAVQPLAQQQSQLDALYAQRNTKGWSKELDAEIKRREQVLASSRKEYEAEPLRAASDRGVPGVEVIAPIDGTSLDTVAATIGARVQQADTTSMQTGKPVSPLLGDEARRLAGMLGALPADQKAGQLAKLATVVPGPQMQALAEQIDEKDRALGLAIRTGNARTTAGRLTSELILRGADKMKDKTSDATANERKRARAEMVEFLDGKTPGAGTIHGKARDSILEAAAYIDASFDRSDPKRAVRLALGGEIVEHNGRRLPVPAGMGYDQLRDRLSKYPAAAIQQQAGDTVMFGGRAVPVDQFVATLPTAQLEPAGLGRYFVQSGAGIATGKNGKPILIDAR